MTRHVRAHSRSTTSEFRHNNDIPLLSIPGAGNQRVMRRTAPNGNADSRLVMVISRASESSLVERWPRGRSRAWRPPRQDSGALCITRSDGIEEGQVVLRRRRCRRQHSREEGLRRSSRRRRRTGLGSGDGEGCGVVVDELNSTQGGFVLWRVLRGDD